MSSGDMEQDSFHGWHLDRRISLSHIATTLSVAAVVIIFGLRLESRVTLNEHRIEATSQTVKELQKTQVVNQAEIIRRLDDYQNEIVRRFDDYRDRLDQKADRP